MKKTLFSAWLALCFFIGIVPQLAAFNEFVIEKRNKFGGQTTEYSDKKNGVLRGVIYYGANNVKVKERIEYNSESIELYRIEKDTILYSLGVMVKKDSVFTPSYTRENLIKRVVMHYNRRSRRVARIEKYFNADHLGYNITYYRAGIRTRVEWFYPSNTEGIEQHNAYFGSHGEVKKKVEYIYTPKTAHRNGCYKSIYFLVKGKKVKQTWFFNKEYELQHGGIMQRTEYYYHTPMKKTLIRSVSFDQEGNLVEMKNTF